MDYIFVSHMESDEYGGIRIFLERYPDAKVICSRLASRELPGLGVECDCVAADGDTVIEEDISLKTITYPCEVHLQDGIIAYEQNSGYCTAPTLCKAPGMAGIRSRNADIFPERRASPPYAYRTRRDWKIPNGSSHPYPRGSWRWAMGLFRQRRHYVNN